MHHLRVFFAVQLAATGGRRRGLVVAAGAEQEAVEAGADHLTLKLLALVVEHARARLAGRALAALPRDLQEALAQRPSSAAFVACNFISKNSYHFNNPTLHPSNKLDKESKQCKFS